MQKLLGKNSANRTVEVETYAASEFKKEFTGNPNEPVKTNDDGFIDSSLLHEVHATDVFMDIVLGEDISALKLIYMDGNLAYKGDPSVKMKSQIVGMTITGGLAGSTQKIIAMGKVVDGFFSFPIGASLYLSSDGGISDTPSLSGYLKECGHVLNSGIIFINIKQTISLAV